MLTNPFKDHDQDYLNKVSGRILPEIKTQISAICPDRGIHQIIISHFYSAIAAELKERNITFYTPENEQLLHDIIRRRTDKYSPEQAAGETKPKRKRAVRKRAKQTTAKSASVKAKV